MGISVTTDSFHLVGMGLNKDVVLDQREQLHIDSDSASQAAFLDRLSDRVSQIPADE